MFILLMTSYAHASPAILVLGDSLSAGYGIDPRRGWVQLLRERLEQDGHDYRVLNASISGDTTRGGWERLPKALEQHQPAILILELGANDGLRGFPIPEIRTNLEQIVNLARVSGAKVLLLGMRLPPNYGRRYAERFAELFPQFALDKGIPIVPFFLEGVSERPDLMQEDRLHPNESAQPLLLENIWPRLRPLL